MPMQNWIRQGRGNSEGVTEAVDHLQAAEEMVNLHGKIGVRSIQLGYATRRSSLTAWRRIAAAAAISSVNGSAIAFPGAFLDPKR